MYYSLSICKVLIELLGYLNMKIVIIVPNKAANPAMNPKAIMSDLLFDSSGSCSFFFLFTL